MENIKGSFNRVKEDIIDINHKIEEIENFISKSNEDFNFIWNFVSELSEKLNNSIKFNEILNERLNNISDLMNKFIDMHNKQNMQAKTSTNNFVFSMPIINFKTQEYTFKALNGKIFDISTGNEGVQTNKQTNKQTNIDNINSSYNHTSSNFEEVKNILDSLDSIKKEIRLKFKRLTEQELLIFSTIYQLEEEFGYSDYKSIAKKLNLSESSIRDYVRRLTIKGIPIVKEKINNKEIKLTISPNLRQIAPLSTILTLRDL